MPAEHARVREMQHGWGIDQDQIELLRYALQELRDSRRIKKAGEPVGCGAARHKEESRDFGLPNQLVYGNFFQRCRYPQNIGVAQPILHFEDPMQAWPA